MATHEALQELDLFNDFPSGAQCPLTADDLPDCENNLSWSKHYEQSSRNRKNPDVTKDVVDTLLNEGTVRRSTSHDSRYLVQKEVNDVQWVLVIGDKGAGHKVRWAAVTIYSNYHGSQGTTNSYRQRKRNNSETKYGSLT